MAVVVVVGVPDGRVVCKRATAGIVDGDSPVLLKGVLDFTAAANDKDDDDSVTVAAATEVGVILVRLS